MKSKKGRDINPRILAAVDLVHLNQEQRLRLLGGERYWLNRRNLLNMLLGGAALITLPASLLTSCANSNVPNTPVINITTTTKAPEAVKTFKALKIYYGWDNSYTHATGSTDNYFEILCDVTINPDSLTNCAEIITTDPNINCWWDCPKWDPGKITIHAFYLESGKEYELRISGAIQDYHGDIVDWNGDGIAGDDLVLIFTARGKDDSYGSGTIWPYNNVPAYTSSQSPSCICDAYSSSPCSCQLYRVQ